MAICSNIDRLGWHYSKQIGQTKTNTVYIVKIMYMLNLKNTTN